jgi:hypothetical protein
MKPTGRISSPFVKRMSNSKSGQGVQPGHKVNLDNIDSLRQLVFRKSSKGFLALFFRPTKGKKKYFSQSFLFIYITLDYKSFK